MKCFYGKTGNTQGWRSSANVFLLLFFYGALIILSFVFCHVPDTNFSRDFTWQTDTKSVCGRKLRFDGEWTSVLNSCHKFGFLTNLRHQLSFNLSYLIVSLAVGLVLSSSCVQTFYHRGQNYQVGSNHKNYSLKKKKLITNPFLSGNWYKKYTIM